MFSPVAIVGQACLLPGASSPDQLWRLIAERRSAIVPAPAGRWRGSRERMLSTKICASDMGGFVQGFDALWDPSLYSLDTELLNELDPVLHWLLHVGRNALLDAGIHPSTPRQRIGAIVGNLAYPTQALVDLAQSVHVPNAGTTPRHPLNRFSAGLPVHLLCRGLGLEAGGYAIDAACASSLYAVKLACDWLQAGRANLMLAGAVNRIEGLFIHSGFTALRALSPSGCSRPFHRDADGLVPAEGAALLALKRLADAEADGDRILGVIRGIGLSNDGRGSGLLVPSVSGQVRAMEAAYAQSGLRPRDVSLIECHATGTNVGDAVELESMSQIFAEAVDVPIGSLKSNLGHLVTASGAAGIIKVLQAMRSEVRPATLSALPSLDALRNTAFRVLDREEPWPRMADAPRRAAISSFGFGGNNAHLLLEEYVPGTSYPETVRAPCHRVAVVGMAARAGGGESTDDFAVDFLEARTRIRTLEDGTLGAPAREIRLPGTGLIFPPRDLARTLAQQTQLLEVTAEAIKGLQPLHAERTSVLIGMSCDAESTRAVLRLVLPDLLPGMNVEDLARIERSMDEPLDAARVVGCMPNIPANRLNRQFDWHGPSFTLAAEEISGVRALDVAVQGLASGEIDAAIVGTADFCVEPVHRSACSELPEDRRIPGDGACVLVLKRIGDAIASGDPVLAIVETTDDSSTAVTGAIGERVRQCFGHVHAASGLLEVAAAVVTLASGAMLTRHGCALAPLPPTTSPRILRLRTEALGGQSTTVTLREATGPRSADRIVSHWLPRPEIRTYAGTDMSALAAALESDRPLLLENIDPPRYRLVVIATTQNLAERLSQARSFLERLERGSSEDSAPDGVFFRREPIGGDLAFVFTGAAAAYHDMGRDLLLALPGLARRVGARCKDLDRYAGWIHQDAPENGLNDFQRLCGSSFLCQIHAEFTRSVLGLEPDAAIGLSSGETNALYALGAWDGIHELLQEIESCGLYSDLLAGRAKAVREAWIGRGIAGECWASFWISAPLRDVQEAVAAEPAVHVTIVSSPNDVMIGGENDACRRVVERIGSHRAIALEGDFAVHCPEVGTVADLWRRLHCRPTVQPVGIRFYSNAFGKSYTLSADSIADALTAQALETVDFPRTIRQAWEDGVRVFVEHGPRSHCTQSIKTILGDLPHVAVPMDVPSRSSLLQTFYAAAELWTAGVAVDLKGLQDCFDRNRHRTAEHPSPLVLPAHPSLP
ncbi:MAG TPA: beta-ketoacyl synthase N-terminal-like domain-containing protein, partial [Burkholderiales bacterium]|nr:beta-ketoacyl synthase N-terminal-like domain-containing protein [Burkholderiales bacterium]